MQRRDFITLLGGAAAARPLAARAQQPALPVIGFINSTSPDRYAPMAVAFRQGLKEAGYVEGQNVAIEYRWANGQYDRLPGMVDDLVRRQVSVITANTPANVMVKTATSTIPIVFTTGTDPVRLGLVASLNRPGGNVTGVTVLAEEVAPKRVELAHELVPGATRIGLLVNPRNPSAEALTTASGEAAITLGLQLDVLRASTGVEIEDAFANLVQKQAGALVTDADVFFTTQAERLVALATRYSMPVIYGIGVFPPAGGLMSYGGNVAEAYRLAGIYAGRILKGDKPADLPVQRSTKVELIINLKTAKALGLTVPLSLLGRADELIE
jgi:putative ABC transport system substrate-binding protein